MSQAYDAVARVERRDMRRALTAAAVVAAMVAVATFQLRHEAARASAAAPPAVLAPDGPGR
jgi:hypothetical protein